MEAVVGLKKAENIIAQEYSNFSRKCLFGNPRTLDAKIEYKTLEDKFLRSDSIDEFIDRTVDLSTKLETKGRFDLSDMFINELSKLCMEFNLFKQDFNLFKQAEVILNWAIYNCRQNGDKIHELARLIDFERLYNFRNEGALIEVLFDKKDCCKEILKDYENYAKNFISLNTKPTSKENIEIQLGSTYETLAKLLENKKSEDALSMFEKAKNIFQKLGRYRKVEFFEHRINQIKQNYQPRNGLPE